MRAIFRLMIILSIIVLTAGCQTGQRRPGDTTPTTKFIPLTPGNVWVYDVKIRGEKIQMRIEVGNPVQVEGQQAFPLSYFLNQSPLATQVEYYTPERNAIKFPRIDNVQGQFLKKPVQTLLPLPLEKGKKWEWSGRLVPIGEDKSVSEAKTNLEVTEIEEVTTPAGKYPKAFKVSIRTTLDTEGVDFQIREDRWYVNGVGMVKGVLFQGKDEVLVAELKKFDKK